MNTSQVKRGQKNILDKDIDIKEQNAQHKDGQGCVMDLFFIQKAKENFGRILKREYNEEIQIFKGHCVQGDKNREEESKR